MKKRNGFVIAEQSGNESHTNNYAFALPGFRGVRTDTALKAAHEALNTSNLTEISNYKYALEEATIIAITNQNGIIKKVNDNFCKISKYSERELIGQDHKILNSGYHSKLFFKSLWSTIGKGKIWKGEIRNKAKDGSFYWVDTTIVPFLNALGRPYQYLAMRVDISNRKAVEAYLIQRTAQLGTANEELAFQNQERGSRQAELLVANVELAYQNAEKEKRAADLVNLTADLKSRQQELECAHDLLIREEEKVRSINQELLSLNQELETRVAERTKALAESENRFRMMMETIPQIAWTNTVDGEVTFYNQRWYDYTGLDRNSVNNAGLETAIHPDDLENVLDHYRSIRETANGGELQIRVRRTDGIYLWQLVRLMPIRNEHGAVQLWVGTATDIQELKLLQQQKDDFISIASHELKTPITSLKACLQLLDKNKENPSSAIFCKLVGMANKNLDKVNVLIQDLLNASKVNEGQLHLNKKRYVLSTSMDNCCDHVRSEGTFTIRTEYDEHVDVFADEGRVDQVVINFVNNAMKYASQSKEILIRLESVDGMAKVSVIDKGPGISAEKLPHVFERYYQVDSSGSQYSGLGLGLYICSEIIKKHNGQIGVESELGKGSTFWFTIPLAGFDD
jgi:PAS domain S-box-containing protein